MTAGNAQVCSTNPKKGDSRQEEKLHAAAVRAAETKLPLLLWRQHLARVITREYAPLVEAAREVLERKADCGDHCRNSCPYCGLREALKGVVGHE